MIQRPRRSLFLSSRAALAASVVAVCAVCWANPGDAFAQASSAAAATASAVAAAAATGQTYAVKPGQSLSDVAGALTGSTDKDVRAKMARALFDANPNAFAGHDINRLKLGSTLNVPPMDGNGAQASAVVEASAPASASTSAAEMASEPAPVASASESVAASNVESASAAQPAVTAPASEATPAPSASAPAANAPAASSGGFNPMLIGVAVAVVVALLLVMMLRKGKRRREEEEASAQASEPTPAPAPIAPREAPIPPVPAPAAAPSKDDLEGEAAQRDQAELNAVAASIESDDAPEAPATPIDEPPPEAKAEEPEVKTPPIEPPPSAQPEPPREPKSAPFTPKAPSAPHAAFMPPPPLDALDGAQKGVETRESTAEETAAREALSKEIFARETQLRDAEAKQAAEQEDHARQAREAAEREIAARDAELREAQKHAAEEQAAEAREKESLAARDTDPDDDEPPIEHRFPMPKFPQEAIQALGSLEMNLPPRMELTLDLPSGPVTSHGAENNEPPAKHQPFVPAPAIGSDLEPPSVASQIEAGTAGAASVAGLGATQFAPLSLDFALGMPRSHTEPIPAMTSAQMAAIARNKLELAQEYMELGDLPGARTLLQEVIESNDPATRQRAAALLSTLAPHS